MGTQSTSGSGPPSACSSTTIVYTVIEITLAMESAIDVEIQRLYAEENVHTAVHALRDEARDGFVDAPFLVDHARSRCLESLTLRR